MRKIFKNVALATATITTVATPLILSSCTCHMPKEEPRLTSINVTLPETKIVLEAGEVWTSKPIDVQCFDQDSNPYVAETILDLSVSDGILPEWVSIDNEDKTIHVNGFASPSTHVFGIQAEDVLTGTIKSDVETFTIEIIEPPLFAPDTIEISCDRQNYDIFITDPGNIQMDIIACYQEYPQELVSKECNWTITNVSGPRQTDLDGNPLFYLEPTIKDCQLLISTNIATYYFPGTYKVSITATSVLAPNVSDDITITINLIDGFYYFDDETGYTYTRSTLKENWSLSMLPSTCSAVVDVKTDIYNIPVSKVADNLCSNSGITKMTAILLPDSITEVGNSAFANQYLVYGIRMAGVKYVGESAFEGCYNMTFFQSFNQPTFYGIKAKAFKDCESLIITNSIQHKLAYIGDQAFYNTAIKSINLGEDIETVGVDSFGNCKSLSYIDIITKKPPILSGQLYSGTTNVSGIRVPLNLVEIYKKSPGWSIYQDKITGFQ